MTIKRFVLSAPLLALAASVLPAQTTLKDAYKDFFYVGAALNTRQYTGQDAAGAAIAAAQFSTSSPENDLKWQLIHPQPDKYNWDNADKYVEFGEKNHMYIVGHCLVWHSQVAQWVFQGENGQPLTRDQLLARMRDHIMTVVGRYKGRIKSWDVVNEALNDDGTRRQSQWQRIIGDDFILKAFQFAHEAAAFYLKLSESILREEPGNLRLAEAVAGGFTRYAYAFVAFEAERVESRDARAAQKMRERAAQLYARAHGHAMAALERSVCI